MNDTLAETFDQDRDAADSEGGSRDEVSDFVRFLARMGYTAKGLVYVAVGALSAAAGLMSGSADAEGSKPALARIQEAPWGEPLLLVVAAGMAGYVVWRLVQAFGDPDGRGASARALATRAVLLMSALIYGALGVWIVRTVLSGAPSGGSGTQSWSATLLSQPFGAWLLGAFGVGVVGYGIAEWVKAARSGFMDTLDLDPEHRDAVRLVGRAGLASRGVVFFIIGGFITYAAFTSDPSEARGLEGALEALGRQAFGPWLMGVVALGLMAYGVFQWTKARYRRIGVENR